MPIEILPYQPLWPSEFEKIRTRIESALGSVALRIDHIGSTSVPGLGAKDVIDIQVTVSELKNEIAEKMEAHGFEWCEDISGDHVPRGEDPTPSLWSKLIFKEGKGERRTHIHVRKLGNPNQKYALLFRDYLRAHPDASQTIELIKRELVKRHADDVEAYYDIKDPVYDLIWIAAREWDETLS